MKYAVLLFAGIALFPCAVSASDLSPEFKVAVEDAYRRLVEMERNPNCTNIRDEERNATSAARKKASGLKKTESDKALMSLINNYSMDVNIWHSSVIALAKVENPDCALQDEVAERLARCRTAIDTALKGGEIAPKTVCQPEQ